MVEIIPPAIWDIEFLQLCVVLHQEEEIVLVKLQVFKINCHLLQRSRNESLIWDPCVPQICLRICASLWIKWRIRLVVASDLSDIKESISLQCGRWLSHSRVELWCRPCWRNMLVYLCKSSLSSSNLWENRATEEVEWKEINMKNGTVLEVEGSCGE